MASGTQHHLKHAGIYLLARGIPGLVAFLAIPLFSRMLHQAEYGRYAVVIAVVAIVNAAMFQWLRLAMVRFVPGGTCDPVRLKSTLATASWGLIALLGLIALGVTLLPLADGWRAAIVICWILAGAQALFDLCCEYARAVIRPWRYMTMQIIRTVLWLGLGAALVWRGWGWEGPVAALALAMLASVALFGPLDWRDARPHIDRALLGQLFRYGMPISLTVLLAIILASTDRVLLAAYQGESAAGVYAVAVDFVTQTVALLMMTINMAVFPLAIAAWEKGGPQAALAHMRSNASLLLAVGVPGAVGAAVLAPGLAACLFGPEFAPAADLIPLVAAGGVLACLKAYHFDAAFQFARRTSQQAWIALGIGIFNIALNLYCIPRWGSVGAALATVASYSLALAATILIGRRHVAMPCPGGAMLRVGLATILMAAALVPTRSSTGPAALVLQIGAGAAIYIAVLVGVNFIGLRDVIVGRLMRSRRAASVLSQLFMTTPTQPR